MPGNNDSNKYKYEQLKRFWTKTNKFKVLLNNNFIDMPLSGASLNASIVSVQLPDKSNETLQEWQDTEWKFSTGRISVPQLTITFRDSYLNESKSDTLYRYFSDYSIAQKMCYFDEIKFLIEIQMLNPADGALDGKSYLSTEGILTGVSGVSFNQQNDQIIEFSCTWSLKDKNF